MLKYARGYQPGEEVELELASEQEADLAARGVIAPLERRYRVIASTDVHGAKPGEEISLALYGYEEAALLGSHLELLEEKRAAKTREKASDKER